MQPSSKTELDRLIVRVKGGAGAKSRPYVVAIDGRSGAGKSTLARGLAQALKADIVSGDDFFSGGESVLDQPPCVLADRCIDWKEQRRVLASLHQSEPARFFPYDWAAFDGSKSDTPKEVVAREIVILEGIYSARPELGDLIDLRVLLEVPDHVRHRRLLAREGRLSRWEKQWHDAEDWYFEHTAPRKTFDVVMSG